MLKKIILLSLFCIYFSSCSDKKQQEPGTQSEKIVKSDNKKSTNSIGETLTPEAKKLVQDWNEYLTIDEILNDFYSITTDDALLKAKSLSDRAQELKDSIRIPAFDRPDIKIRLNVLYNHSLRLMDMENISSIKTQEIKTEITNILNAFSAINSKINNLTNQQNIEKQLLDFKNN
jgi:hypothetical protein